MNPEINLLPVFEKRKPESYVGLLLFIVVLGGLIFFLAMYLMGIKQDAADLLAQEQALITERATLQDQLATADPEPEITYADAVLFVETRSYPVSPLYEEIQDLAGPTRYVKSYSFNPSQIAIHVDFETKSDIAFFIEDMMKSNYFEDVRVSTISEFELISTIEESENLVEEDDVAPRYTASITVIPLPEFVSEGVTQP
ncbi:PilN domain-containing protein [Chryseomicrobium palamuruense]|uniref:PilN domain-containing protein n=1 Tax=Chryseomicrobium palamuruense TaxID=682973 RepID=A0ABV8UYF5_9BACL